jgi:chemotaxis protein methyltransferase CheR
VTAAAEGHEVSALATRILGGVFETRTGQELAEGRRWKIGAALTPLLARFSASGLDELAVRISGGREPALADAVVMALLNHETFFFRDNAAFQQFATHGLDRLRLARSASRRLRLWSAGCSTGQETYTLAMLIAERPDLWEGWTIDILGTDLSPLVIERARAGVYSQFEIQRGLPVGLMLRRFEQQGERWTVDDRLRAAVRFQTHNLLDPAPAGTFDLVLCRNVLFYFAVATRRQVFERLADAIAPDGVLMLGAGETMMGQTDRFVSDPACPGLYRAAGAATAPITKRANA